MRALGKFAHRDRKLHALGYLALALTLGIGIATLALKGYEGPLVPPLDDSYIYLQYARAAAEGRPLEYQEGSPPTRGATSLIYPLLLAPFARALPPDRLFWAAWALGVLTLAGSAVAAHHWARLRLGSEAAPVAGLAVLASGHYVWGCLSGMEIGLFGLAFTGSLALVAWYAAAESASEGVRRLVYLAGALTLLGLARPEGILISGVMALVVVVGRSAPNSRRARCALFLAPLLVGMGTAGINLAALGDSGSNTLAAKAVWSEQRPDVRRRILMRLPWVWTQITGALFTDFHSPSFRAGTGWLLGGIMSVGAVLGVIGTARGGDRMPERVLFAGLFVALLTGLIPAGFNSHHHRYQIPYVPAAGLLVLSGWWWVLKIPPARRLIATVWLVLLLPGLWRFAHTYAANSENIHDHQVTTGRWIAQHLPAGSKVAVNDAGAIPYFSGYPILDLVGLVSNGPALAHRAGQGTLYEWLEALPEKERPEYFAVFPDWFPYLRRTSLFGERLVQFRLESNTISGAAVKAVYKASWQHTALGDSLVIRSPLVDLWGFSIVDHVDVANLASQTAHRYVAFDTWRDTLREFVVSGRPETRIIDGGRQPTRGERFTLRTRAGVPGALVMRTEAFRPFSLDVFVDGTAAGRWDVSRETGRWIEPVFDIPGDLFTGTQAVFELRLPEDAPPYPSFHYWLLQ